METSNKNSTVRRKLALIIANDNYNQPYNKLNYSVKNGNDLKQLLETINFNVTIYTDSRESIMEKIADFADTIQEGDLILFYYCGHAYQIYGGNYLIPIDDGKIDLDSVQDIGINVQSVVRRLVKGNDSERNLSYATIFIFDVGSPYFIVDSIPPCSVIEGNGLHDIVPPDGVFIQFACAANKTIRNDSETYSKDLFIKHLLKNLTQKNVHVADVFQQIANDVSYESHQNQNPSSMDGLAVDQKVYLNEILSDVPDIVQNSMWESNADTVVGGHGPGPTLNRLHSPKGIYVDKEQTVYIADFSNHRIIKFNRGKSIGIRVTFNSGSGYEINLLHQPSMINYDKSSNTFLICDYYNQRIIKLSSLKKEPIKIEMNNVKCSGLAIDDEGSIYISDSERHVVERYTLNEANGTVVAGGNGQGNRLNQLNHPTYIYVGIDQAVYVSDSMNDRVVKWEKDALKGIIVAGGHGKGKDRNQLNYPTGLLSDRNGAIYVADYWNHRVMRWYDGASHGCIIAGCNTPGDSSDRLNCPEGLAFDSDGNLYVADSNNHRIQRFRIKHT